MLRNLLESRLFSRPTYQPVNVSASDKGTAPSTTSGQRQCSRRSIIAMILMVLLVIWITSLISATSDNNNNEGQKQNHEELVMDVNNKEDVKEATTIRQIAKDEETEVDSVDQFEDIADSSEFESDMDGEEDGSNNVDDKNRTNSESLDETLANNGSISTKTQQNSTSSIGEESSRRWFDFDQSVGLDPRIEGRRTIWNHEISLAANASRTQFQRRTPNFAFIKGLKVGGTTVAVALDHAARMYKIKLNEHISEKENIKVNVPANKVSCSPGTSLWYHHGFKHYWMAKCMPGVRYLTMLRDPVSQALSWETMAINQEYYKHYPRHPCERKRYISLNTSASASHLHRMLGLITNCVDTEYRKNLTMLLVADKVRSWKPTTKETENGFPGAAVAITAQWILGYRKYSNSLTSELLIDYMKKNYFLVGVVERMNEFLVLLALHMGWDLSAIYYVKCKPTDLDVHRTEFARHFPDLAAKLERSAKPSMEAYEWARQEFDSHVSQLGPWFKELVTKYEAGLKSYNRKHHHPHKYRWMYYQYNDGHTEDC